MRATHHRVHAFLPGTFKPCLEFLRTPRCNVLLRATVPSQPAVTSSSLLVTLSSFLRPMVKIGTLMILSWMMFPNEVISSSWATVVPRNLQCRKYVWHQLFYCKRFLLVSEFAEPALVRVGLIGNVLKTSSKCATSFARPLSLMFLIDAAYTECLSDVRRGSYLRTVCRHTSSPFCRLHLLHHSQWSVSSRFVKELAQGCLGTPSLSIPMTSYRCRSCRRCRLAPASFPLGKTTLASADAGLPCRL